MRYPNRRVILLCRCESQTEHVAFVMSSDNRQIQIHKRPGSQFPDQPGNVVEVVAKITPTGVLHEEQVKDLSNGEVPFNWESYNDLCNLAALPDVVPIFGQ